MFLGDRAVTPSCYALASHSRSANARKYCMTGRRHNVGSLHDVQLKSKFKKENI